MSWAWPERTPVTPYKIILRLRWLQTLSASLLLLVTTCSHAAEARIAVASNFRDTALAIAEQLEATSPHRYQIIAGSTGKLASQSALDRFEQVVKERLPPHLAALDVRFSVRLVGTEAKEVSA